MNSLQEICGEIIGETIVEDQCYITEYGIFHKETDEVLMFFERPISKENLNKLKFRVRIDY